MDQKSPEAFRTISEVADWLGVPTHVLRFWESRFAQVKPIKRAGGRRYYRPSDMELLGGIRKLLHEDGMTIRGVQKLLREQGVKHVAAMSPPLDAGADERDLTPDNVVDLSDRRELREEVEDAEIVEAGAEAADDGEKRFPFDDEPTPAAAEGAQEAAAEPLEAVDETSGPDLAESEPEPGDAEAEPAAVDTEPDTATEPADVTDPLPSPETMEFLAHEAEPDSVEGRQDTGAAPEPEPAPEPETDPHDPMSSPDALAFAAHDAMPETVEAAPDEGEHAAPEAEPEPAEAAREAESEAVEPEPEPEPAPPALVMPEIGDDPDDDDLEPAPLYAAELRALRAARAEVNLAALQALADRLDEITRGIGKSG